MPAAGAPPTGALPTRSVSPPLFWVDTQNTLGEDGHPRVRVTVSVPYNQLHFVRDLEGGYEAVFDISQIFYGKKDRQVAGDVWRHRVRVDHFKETRKRDERFADTQEFQLAAGRYTLVCRVGSFGTSTRSEARRPIVVRGLGDQEFAVVAVELGSCDRPLERATGLEDVAFEPIPSRRVGEPLPPVCARIELFDRRSTGAPQRVRCELKIIDDFGHVHGKEGYSLSTTGLRTEFVVSVPVTELAPGAYKLECVGERQGETAALASRFEVDGSRIDLSRNYDEMLELASLFLDENVRGRLGGLEDIEARQAAWEALWAAHDPDPDTAANPLQDEFFQRIRVAGERYSVRGRPGWQSDRGKVFVRNGDPSSIEYQPAQGFSSPAFEIWRYRSDNLTYVFADHSGFGDFVLVRPGLPY